MQETLTNDSAVPASPGKGTGRYLFIDLIKAITILLVVWGHMIQYLHGSGFDYWSDWVFKWIYGFHMPIFALVSGFLHACSRKTGFGRSIVKKAKQLLLPVLLWAFILTILDCVFNLVTHETNSLGFVFDRFLTRCLNDLWFLKGTFLCYLLVALAEKATGKTWVRVVLLAAAGLSTVFWPRALGFYLYGFLVPYYFMGYIAGVCMKDPGRIIARFDRSKWGVVCTAVLCVVYLMLLLLYNKQHYIYTSGLSIIKSEYGVWEQIGIDLMRFITGVIGCLMLISLCCTVQSVVPKRMISWATEISSSTLAIYAISSSLFIYLPQVLLRMKLSGVLSRIPVYLWDAAFLLPLSLALVAACLWVSKKLSRSRVFVLLLGK